VSGRHFDMWARAHLAKEGAGTGGGGGGGCVANAQNNVRSGMLQCRDDDVVVRYVLGRECMSYSALAGAWD